MIGDRCSCRKSIMPNNVLTATMPHRPPQLPPSPSSALPPFPPFPPFTLFIPFIPFIPVIPFIPLIPFPPYLRPPCASQPRHPVTIFVTPRQKSVEFRPESATLPRPIHDHPLRYTDAHLPQTPPLQRLNTLAHTPARKAPLLARALLFPLWLSQTRNCTASAAAPPDPQTGGAPLLWQLFLS